MKYYRYTFDGGKEYQDGKVNWPDVIVIYLTKYKALDIISQLANQISMKEFGVDAGCEFTLPGMLEDITDEE
jgi:hypothetical protein